MSLMLTTKNMTWSPFTDWNGIWYSWVYFADIDIFIYLLDSELLGPVECHEMIRMDAIDSIDSNTCNNYCNIPLLCHISNSLYISVRLRFHKSWFMYGQMYISDWTSWVLSVLQCNSPQIEVHNMKYLELDYD